MGKRRLISDVLEPEFAQQLINEGWTILEIAMDFDIDYDAMRFFLRKNGVKTNTVVRSKPVKLLDFIELETLIERIRSGETLKHIASTIDGIEHKTISYFIQNHHSNVSKIKQDPTDFIKVVRSRQESRRKKKEQQGA